MPNNQIIIDSFQGGLSTDRNIGQRGAFWNSKNIEYRKNSSYVELTSGITNAMTFTGLGIPVALAYWANGGTLATDLVTFTNTGHIVTSAGNQMTLTNGSIVNICEANSKKYLIGVTKLNEFLSTTSVTENVVTFAKSKTIRPVLNFYGDLIIGNGNEVLRYNKDGTLIEYNPATPSTVIGSLDGDVHSITQIGANIFVWCNNGIDTNLYLWDGITGRPSQKIRYADSPVRNVALLGNMHYWWSNKSDYSIRKVMIGESYQPQIYAKSVYPEYPLTTKYDGDKNRIALTDDSSIFVNAIETVGDIVYLPGYKSIYAFGRYYPSSPYSICREISFTGSKVYCMTSGGTTTGGKDASGFLAFSTLNGSNYETNIVNLGQDGENPGIFYNTAGGEIESMEYIAPSFAQGEDNKKVIVPFYLPDTTTSIKVSYQINRSGSYTLLKTINTTDYGVGYNSAEISFPGKWKTLQFKFELLTTDSNYSPKLYTGIINESITVGNQS